MKGSTILLQEIKYTIIIINIKSRALSGDEVVLVFVKNRTQKIIINFFVLCYIQVVQYNVMNSFLLFC